MDDADRKLIEATARGVAKLLALAVWPGDSHHETIVAMRELHALLRQREMQLTERPPFAPEPAE